MTKVNKIGMHNPPTEKVEDILCNNVGYNLPSSPEKHILSIRYCYRYKFIFYPEFS